MGCFALDKIRKIDEKYGVQQVVVSLIDKIQTFNKKHSISEKITESTKSFNDKYHVTDYVNKIVENEKIQTLSKKVTETVSNTMAKYEEIECFEKNQKLKSEENGEKEKGE